MTQYKQELSVPPDDVDAVHDFLKTVWDTSPTISMRDQFSFETAIIELASNVILHAAGNSPISCNISVETFPDHIEATMTDSGERLDLALDDFVMPDDLSETGRGIPLIRGLVDEFTFENHGERNLWRISRKFQSC